MKRKWERFKVSCREKNWNKHCKEAHLDPAKKNVNSHWELHGNGVWTLRRVVNNKYLRWFLLDTSLWKKQVLQTLAPDFPLHMLLYAGWGCQLRRRSVRWSFLFCPHFRDEGRNCGKFLGAQKWPLSKLELALLPTLLSPPLFCLIMSLVLYSTYLQACPKHPVTVTTEIIYTRPRLIWRNSIYKVLAIALMDWFTEPKEEKGRRKGPFVKAVFWKTKNKIK